jgi:hypothetical protein
MLVIVAAVLFAIAQAQTAQTAAERAARTARAARDEAGAALGAKVQADGAAEEALAGLDQIRAQTVEQLAACQAAAEQAQTAARIARTELEDVRAAAAKAVTAAKEAAEVAVRKAIVDRDWGLAERVDDLREQIEQTKTDTQAQVKAIEGQVDAAKVEAEQLVKNIRANSSTRPTRRPASKPRKPPNEP